ncbi:MAG: hypothetical protein ABSG95_01180 [Solirubrobacteraceae bacterium]|jgi:hypothetical protein
MSFTSKPIPCSRRLPAGLLGAALALAVGSGLLLPSAAPASRHRRNAQPGASAPTSSSETAATPPGETAATPPGNTAATPPGETAASPNEAISTPGEPSGRSRRGRETRTARAAGCRLQISVAPGVLTAGESARTEGDLSCPSAAAGAGQTVIIYQHLAGLPGVSVAGTATTEADGTYQLISEPLLRNAVFYARCDGLKSARARAKVAVRVSISGPPEDTQLLLGAHSSRADAHPSSTVTFTGTVSPVAAGTPVVLQRESASASEDWRRIGLGAAGTDGKYSITHTFAIPGAANIRVVVRGRGLNLAGASEPLSYEIEQRQNPRLTVWASSDTLSAGQSVTLRGIAAGAAHQPLTLLARTRSGAFAPVATVISDAAGNYSFPAQSPPQSTFYRVRDARSSSSTLFEGVRPMLTAEVSTTSVEVGRPLIFTGTITPGHAGQVIYLERQNPSGIGFHIVEESTLGAGSSYSIEHTVLAAGPQVFRIKVPRDAETQAAASTLFKVQVTPAPRAEPLAPPEP